MSTLLITALPSALEGAPWQTCAVGGVDHCTNQCQRVFANPEMDMR